MTVLSTSTGTLVPARASDRQSRRPMCPPRRGPGPPPGGPGPGQRRYRGSGASQELTNWPTSQAMSRVTRGTAVNKARARHARAQGGRAGATVRVASGGGRRLRDSTATTRATTTAAQAAEARALNESPKKSSTAGWGAHGAPVLLSW